MKTYELFSAYKEAHAATYKALHDIKAQLHKSPNMPQYEGTNEYIRLLLDLKNFKERIAKHNRLEAVYKYPDKDYDENLLLLDSLKNY